MAKGSLKDGLLSRLILVPVLLLAVLTGVLALQVHFLQSSAGWVDHTDQVISAMNLLLRTIIDQETGIRGYLLTGQPEFLRAYNSGRAETDQRFADLQRLVSDNPAQEDRLRLLVQAEKDWAVLAAGRLDEKISRQQFIADNVEARQRMDRIRSLAGDFIQQENILRARRSAHSALLSGAILVTLVCVSVLVAGSAVFFIRRLRRSERLYRELTARYSVGELALHETESRYRTLFDSIDEGFCIIEMIFDSNGKPADYRFLEINPSFEKQTGLVDAVGKTMRELAPRHEQHWFDIYGAVARTGEPVRFQNRAEQLHRFFDAYAFRLGRPEERRVAIIFHDITERKLTERALLRAEKLAVIGRMASTIAHEINNPLGAALNSLYLASLDANLSEASSEHIILAQRELERVANITKQTLGFYRETGLPAKIDLREISEDVVSLYLPKLESKDIQIERRYSSDTVALAIEGEVRQILSNLLSNCIDAVSRYGSIQLRISGPKRLSSNRPELRLTFSDNGAGIDPQNMEHIFEPFFSTKPSTGTGLGLWVTQQLVKKHGGRIRARSKVGVGTVFQVFLPAERRNESRLIQEDQDVGAVA